MKKTLIFGFSMLVGSGVGGGVIARVPASAETSVQPPISGYIIRAGESAVDSSVVVAAPRIRVAPVVSVPASATLIVGERVVAPEIIVDEVPEHLPARTGEVVETGKYDRPEDHRPVVITYAPIDKWISTISRSLSIRSRHGKRRLTQNDIRKAVLNTPCACELNLQANGVTAESHDDGYQAIDIRLVRGRLVTKIVMS